MSGDVTIHDSMELAGGLSVWLFDQIYQRDPQIHAGGEIYVPAGSEEVLGAGDDEIIFRRKRDGALLRVDVEVYVSPYTQAGAS